ncbi:hypothetical protein [Streptomyces sp. NRRL S-813]|uniref:hypothetical protein n=1 Tax=Streptomyces sp. NRRL S-813 TaxID=1463919 RepID=UPI000AE0F1F9|nr:hypothetical protein [Streptomyces sp. NRRL S-813]
MVGPVDKGVEARPVDRRQPDDSDPVLRRRIEDVSQLINVLRFCVDKDVELIFG